MSDLRVSLGSPSQGREILAITRWKSHLTLTRFSLLAGFFDLEDHVTFDRLTDQLREEIDERRADSARAENNRVDELQTVFAEALIASLRLSLILRTCRVNLAACGL